MSFLIDGNNVMAQRVGWHKDKARARRRLMDELAAFARTKRTQITVVFDGAPEPHFPDGASYRGIRLFYAERGSNADERIKRIAETSRERRTLTVVTSDRALGDYIRRCGVSVMRSGDFRTRMEEAVADQVEDANERPAEEDLGKWMRYFGVGPDDE